MNEYALELVAMGYAIFQLPPRAKAAKLLDWQHKATLDANLVAAWWDQMPDGNIGVVPRGPQAVIDVDPRDGGTGTLARLEARLGEIGPTLEVASGGDDKGRHLYLVADHALTRGGKLGAGLELRCASRAYVLGAGSIHPQSGRRYAWTNDLEPATLPQGFIDLILKPDLNPDDHVKLHSVPSSVGIKDERLLRLLDTPGPNGDVSAGDFAVAARAIRLGYPPHAAASLVIDHRERHGDPRGKASRVDYLERTITAALDAQKA